MKENEKWVENIIRELIINFTINNKYKNVNQNILW